MFLYMNHFWACTYHILGTCSAFPLQKYYNFADCTNLPLFFPHYYTLYFNNIRYYIKIPTTSYDLRYRGEKTVNGTIIYW